MKLHAELIFIWRASHLDSFWNRGTRELGNGLLKKSIAAIIPFDILQEDGKRENKRGKTRGWIRRREEDTTIMSFRNWWSKILQVTAKWREWLVTIFLRCWSLILLPLLCFPLRLGVSPVSISPISATFTKASSSFAIQAASVNKTRYPWIQAAELSKRGTHRTPNMFDAVVQTNKTSPIKHENKTNVLSCLIECLMAFKFYQTRSNSTKQGGQMVKFWSPSNVWWYLVTKQKPFGQALTQHISCHTDFSSSARYFKSSRCAPFEA